MVQAHSEPILRIRPSSGWRSLRIDEIWAYHDVWLMLAARDLKLRYRQTALGVLWVVLQPLLSGVIFAVIFGHFAKLPSGGRPYLLFVFAGLMGWNLFAGVVQRAGGSLVAEARLITKVYFPRLLIPCAAAASAAVDFAVSLLVMAGLLAWHGVWPGAWLWLLPPIAALTFAGALGAGLWVAALNVRYRDFAYALPFLLQVWMYASPVVYGTELVSERWRTVFALNPMTGILDGMRAALTGGPVIWSAIAISAAVALIALVTGMLFFRRVERDFADQL
jgi:lipopolysaccharide transport system permease protein